MNILYIGSAGVLSLAPFEKLLAAGHTIKAVGVFAPTIFKDKIIALENASLALATSQKNIPLLDLSKPLSSIIAQCRAMAIDIILMSCYSKRLPDELIDLPSHGCFNMHPSLLPCYRGPEPIFWQMKQGSALGVSWHRVVHDFDAGDVVAQQKLFTEDGSSYAEIQLKLADNGAKMALKLLQDVQGDSLSPCPQHPDKPSYYPYPQQNDFVVDTGCSAQHAYNFMCATQAFGYSYRCRIGKDIYLLEEALDFDNNRCLECAEAQADRLYIPCADGVLIASYTDKMKSE